VRRGVAETHKKKKKKKESMGFKVTLMLK